MRRGQTRQAIVTSYRGPTNTRGSAVLARADAGSIRWDWDYDLSAEENHWHAAVKLAGRFGWLERNDLVCGALPKRGYVFVLVERAK